MSGPAAFPDGFEDLLQAPGTAVLVTLLGDGSPQATPVWYLFRDGALHVSTTKNRQKHLNLLRDPRLALTIFDAANPLRYIEVRGSALLHDDPHGEVRDAIARKHGFADGSAFDKPGEERVTVTIEPTRVRGR